MRISDWSSDVCSSDLSEAMAKINALPTLNNLPQGVRKIDIGDAKWQAEMVANFATAVMSGVLLVFAVLVLPYKRILPPFVNMGSLMLAPLGGALALHVAGTPLSMPVLSGLLLLLGLFMKISLFLIDYIRRQRV